MEGDVMLSGLSLPVLLAVGGAVLGGVFALLKWFAARLIADFEARLSRIDDLAREVSRVDGEVQRLLAELPLHYQRREDAIREFTAINAKLDRLYELLARRHDHD
jgi:hypothetical protein